MTLDEAIKHIEKVAEENQRIVDTGILFDNVTIDMFYCDDTEVIEEHLANYQKCAERHRQFAEWLKDYKRLLGQKPCDDTVSRQAVLGLFAQNVDAVRPYSKTWEEVRALPPVNPQQKTGHWEKMVEVYDLQQNRMLVPYGYDDAKFGNTPVYVCDCGYKSNKNSRFCPDCGAKMVEPQESEDLGDYPDTIRNQFDNMTGSMNL